MSLATENAANWESMMQGWPRDGWDGAAAIIAKHDHAVCDLEQELDQLDPDWHTKLSTQYPRRTRSSV